MSKITYQSKHNSKQHPTLKLRPKQGTNKSKKNTNPITHHALGLKHNTLPITYETGNTESFPCGPINLTIETRMSSVYEPRFC